MSTLATLAADVSQIELDFQREVVWHLTSRQGRPPKTKDAA